MRVVAAAILILAGIIGIGIGDVAQALVGGNSAFGAAITPGWIVYILGFALLIIEYIARSPAVRKICQRGGRFE